jgi:hypothetical protein
MSQPQQAASAKTRRFFSSQAKALLGTVVVVVAIGVAALPWMLATPARLSALIAASVPELRGDVRIERVRLGWTGPLVLEGVAVVPRAGGEPPLRIGRIETSHGLAAMLLSGGDLGRVRLEGLDVGVVYDANRRSNLETLIVPAASGGGSTAASPPRPGRVRLRLEVAAAVVRIAGPWTQEPWVSDPINLRAALGPSADGPWSEWVIEPVQLLADARLEPGVAQGVLAYIAPVLADATRTSGRFSLRLDGAKLPVGRPEAGTLSGVLAMHEVVLGPGPLVTRLFQSLPGRPPVPPAIRVADESHVAFRLAERRMWHEGLEFGVPLAKPGQRLDVRSSGSVGIDDKSLDVKLSLPIPADLPQDRPLLAALAGKSISVGIGGVLGQPQVNFDGSIKAAAGGVVTDLIERLRGGSPQPTVPQGGPPMAEPGSPPQPGWRPGEPTERTPSPDTPAAGGGNPSAEAIVDLVGGVLEEVAKRRAERRAAEATDPDQPPPRRGRLLRRLVPPTDPVTPPPAPSPSPSSP